MTEPLLPTHAIQSKRILLSNVYWHTVELSEQQMGIIQHALYALHHAFAAEPDYLNLIDEAAAVIKDALERPAYTDPLSRPR